MGRKNGKDVIKKILPMLISSKKGSKEYHTNYQRLNRHVARERKVGAAGMRQLELQASRLFEDLEKTLTRTRLLL